MSVGRVVGVGLGLGVLLVAIGYAGASWLLFDAASKVDARCGFFEDDTPRFTGYTPAAFGTDGVSEDSLGEGFDTTAYAMPEYEEVSFQSRDGVDLAAWWVPGATPDAPAVVVVHGKGSCRRDPVVLLPAGMLNRYGFAVLLIDVRDMGDSEVIDGRYSGGTQEYPDALGAWDWLRERGLPAGSIGLLGESNGAAAVVIAAGEEPEIAATWEDSGYSDTTTVIREEVRYQGYPEVLTEGAVLWARLFGIDLDEQAADRRDREARKPPAPGGPRDVRRSCAAPSRARLRAGPRGGRGEGRPGRRAVVRDRRRACRGVVPRPGRVRATPRRVLHRRSRDPAGAIGAPLGGLP